jgi:hypothetical protein
MCGTGFFLKKGSGREQNESGSRQAASPRIIKLSNQHAFESSRLRINPVQIDPLQINQVRGRPRKASGCRLIGPT